MGQVEHYKLERPTKEKALQVFEDAFDRESAEHMWEGACQATGVDTNCTSLAELNALFTYFSKQSGRAAVCGMSLKMRLMTYNNLISLDERNLSFS